MNFSSPDEATLSPTEQVASAVPILPRIIFSQLNIYSQLIAWDYFVAKLYLVDTHENRRHALILGHSQHQYARSLSHGFDLQHSRHNRLTWVVALEILFVDRAILYSRKLVITPELDHPINHKHRVAVRERFDHPADVQFGFHFDYDFTAYRRFLRVPFFELIHSLVKLLSQFLVQGMPWADCDDVGL